MRDLNFNDPKSTLKMASYQPVERRRPAPAEPPAMERRSRIQRALRSLLRL